VDEYQDLDDAQYRLVRQLVAADGNLCAIGDPDQSIYGFRGANPQVFLQFERDFPGARVVHLQRNYRSSQTIVAAAVQAIAPSSLVANRTLESLSENAERIHIEHCATERAEAEFVVHTIERLIGGSTFFSLDSGRVAGHEGDALSFADFAVLYRTEAQAAALVEGLARSGIPFQQRSHRRLSDEPAGQALVRQLRDFAVGSPQRPRGPVTDLLKQAADAVWGSHPEIADQLPDLFPLAQRSGENLDAFLVELTLAAAVDLWDPRADRVSLLTLHASKGLEFPVVFLPGCEDGLLPLSWGDGQDTDVAEERRLFFVGLTRARDRLILSHAAKRLWRGRLREMAPSPFLAALQDKLLERGRRHSRGKAKTFADRQLELF
jgi:DNA helicase-2/ATP-dependent DNA helicase PcrA